MTISISYLSLFLVREKKTDQEYDFKVVTLIQLKLSYYFYLFSIVAQLKFLSSSSTAYRICLMANERESSSSLSTSLTFSSICLLVVLLFFFFKPSFSLPSEFTFAYN